MSLFKNFFKPKQDNFIRYLTKQAELGVTGLEALVDYMATPTPEHAARVNRAEKEADEVRRMLIDDLNNTFVTPFDREDIFALSGAADDLLDYAQTTVGEMEMLKVEPDEHMKKMAALLLDAAQETYLAMQRIEDHPNVANDHARQAKRVENRMEKAYHEALAALFSGVCDCQAIVLMLKKREIYRHLSNAADRADEAANLINNIVVKST